MAGGREEGWGRGLGIGFGFRGARRAARARANASPLRSVGFFRFVAAEPMVFDCGPVINGVGPIRFRDQAPSVAGWQRCIREPAGVRRRRVSHVRSSCVATPRGGCPADTIDPSGADRLEVADDRAERAAMHGLPVRSIVVGACVRVVQEHEHAVQMVGHQHPRVESDARAVLRDGEPAPVGERRQVWVCEQTGAVRRDDGDKVRPG